MNPSYFRIKLPMKEAIQRLCKWNEQVPAEQFETTYDLAVDQSIDIIGNWKGSCLFVYEKKGWTVFEDLSGRFSAIPGGIWKIFAGNDDLIMAGYNDVIPYGEFIVIQDGNVQKEFFEEADYVEERVNDGTLYTHIKSWDDVADFVDNDEILYAEQGTVIIF